VLFAFEFAVDFVGCLGQKEESAQNQNQVPPRDLGSQNAEERFGEAHDPRQGEQERNAAEKGEGEANRARSGLLVLWKSSRKDRDEDDVVDSQDDLEGGQRAESDPGLRVGDPVQWAVRIWFRSGRYEVRWRAAGYQSPAGLRRRSRPSGSA